MFSKNVKRLGAAVAVVALGLGTAAGVNASPQPSDSRAADIYAAQARKAGLNQAQASKLQARVDGYLDRLAIGARQVSANEIVTDDGARLTLALPGTDRAHSLTGDSAGKGGSCNYGRVCLWTKTSFYGDKASFSKCRFYKLRYYDFTNKMSSWINNQTRGTYDRYYYWTGSKWKAALNSEAPESVPQVPSTLDNKIDAVRPC